VISPPDVRYLLVGVPSPNTAAWERALNAISPNQLYGEAAAALLATEARAVGTTDYIGYLTQLQGAIRGSVLPLKESLAIAWPQTVSLIAGVIVLFVAGYVVFQRQEVRA
jgi:ABC-2 type transport system permease protein